MLAINDLKAGIYIVYQDEPFVILKHDFIKMGRGQGVMRTSIKNLKTGKILDHSFRGQDRVAQADISRAKANYLYHEGNDYFFMDQKSYDQFFVIAEQLGKDKIPFLKENLEVDVLMYNGTPINVELPKKVTFTVVQAPPGVRGDTAQGSVTKKVTLETGQVIDAPLFINQDDKVIVNTETGKYVSKA